MKINISQIIEGWKNHLLPNKEMLETIEQVSKERLLLCRHCKFNTTPGNITNLSRCGACGCLLKPKSKCLSCNCGIEAIKDTPGNENLQLLWSAVASVEENEHIHTKLKEAENEN
jgi:hypothetical protein